MGGSQFEKLRLNFFNLHDGFFLNVYCEANPVANAEALEQRRRIDLVTHCHRIHKSLNRAMLDDNLAAIRHCSDDLPLARNSGYRSRLTFMMGAMIRLLRCSNCRDGPWRRRIRDTISQSLRRRL